MKNMTTERDRKERTRGEREERKEGETRSKQVWRFNQSELPLKDNRERA